MRLPALTMRQRLLAIACGAAVATGVALTALHLGFGEMSLRARAARLAAANDAELAGLLRSWAVEDGEPSAVVECLRDPRPAVAAAAAAALREQLTAWRSLRSAESSPHIARLARSLAEQQQTFSPHGRRAANAIAQQLVTWPLDDATVDVLAVLADCDAVLRATAARPQDLLLAVADGRSPGDAGMMIGRRETTSDDTQIGPVAELPGGGLPWEAADIPPSEPPPHPATEASPTPAAEAPFAAPREIYAPLATPLDALDGKERIDDKTAAQPDSTLRTTGGVSPAAIDERDDWTLMKLLHSASAGTEAEEQLRRRGFNAHTLALARQMTDPDPQLRRELAEMLPRVAHIDPQPWLLQLTRDADAEVRATAIAILGSSSDASVTRWLESLHETERDARVLARIDELLRERR